MGSFFAGKHILVTGVCSTVGRHLASQLLNEHDIAYLKGFDINEMGIFSLTEKFSRHDNTCFLKGDVRDKDFVSQQMKDIDIIFHCATFADIVLCEHSPYAAVQTNIIGVQNVIDAAYENDAERVMLISSQKAVNPVSVMGTSKLMSEQMITAANSLRQNGRPIFASTRLGHVLGARGSVMPVFGEQIRRGGPVTLTNPYMARFMTSPPEAVKLVLEATYLAKGGEVFIAKMPVVRIVDLAEVMIELLGPVHGHDPGRITLEIIGPGPGEKIYEELMTQEETGRACELKRLFVVCPELSSQCQIIPQSYGEVISVEVDTSYNSELEKPLTKEELARFLTDSGFLQDAFQPFPKVLN